MDRQVFASKVLQKLSQKLEPTQFSLATDIILQELMGATPALLAKAVAVAKAHTPAVAARAHEVKQQKRRRQTTPGAPLNPASKSGRVRELLTIAGPQTVEEIRVRLALPEDEVIHPILAAIGAKPVGTKPDESGTERKLYGFWEDAAEVVQPNMQPI